MSGAVASQHRQGKSHLPLHSEHHAPFQLTFVAISPYSLYSGKVLMSLRKASALPLKRKKKRKRHEGLFYHPDKVSHSLTKTR